MSALLLFTLLFTWSNDCLLDIYRSTLESRETASPFAEEEEDCHGLEGAKVLLVDVHLEGNLGDELETRHRS